MTDLSLHDYFTQIAQDVKDGKPINLAQLESYKEWRVLCEKQPDLILLINADPKEGRVALLEYIEHPETFLSDITTEAKDVSLPSSPEAVLRQSYPTEVITPAREQAHSILTEQQRKVTESVLKNRKLTQKFFKQYQDRLFQRAPEKKTEIAKEIRQAERLAPLKTFEEVRNDAIVLARTFGNEQDVKEVTLLIDSYAPEMDIPEIARPIQVAREVNRIVIENRDITTPDIVAQAIESGSNKQQSTSFARTYETVSQTRTSPSGIRSFGEPAPKTVAPVAQKFTEAAAHAPFVRIWTHATSDQGFIGRVALRIGKNVAESPRFKQYIIEATTHISQQKPASGAAVSLVSDVFASGQQHSEVVADYAAALWQHGQTAHTGATETFPSFMEYLIVWERRNSPESFTTTSSGLLQWGAQIGLEKAAKATLGSGAKVAAEKVGLSLGIKGLGAAIGGPPGWIVAVAGTKLLEWGGKIVGGTIQAAGYIFSGGTISTILQGKSASLTDTLVLFPVILIVALVLLFAVPILPFLNFADFPQTNRNVALVTSMGGGAASDNIQPFNISITATAVPGLGGVPSAINYTITVSSINGEPLTITEATVIFSVYGVNGTISPITISPSQFSNGSYTFTIPVNQQLSNSIVTGTVNITADTSTQRGVSGVASTSTIIGNPSSGCFVFGGAGHPDNYGYTSSNWNDKAKVLAAIGELARSPQYMTQLCKAGNPSGPDIPITLYFANVDYGGGSTYDANTIFIYQACVAGTQRCMNYTLAHESGHIISHRTGLFGAFNTQALYAREGPIWTYPNNLTEGEDFAETLGDYVVWRYYPFGERHGHSGHLNYPQTYPLHYQFAKSVFGIEY